MSKINIINDILFKNIKSKKDFYDVRLLWIMTFFLNNPHEDGLDGIDVDPSRFIGRLKIRNHELKSTKTAKVAIDDKPKSQYGVLPWRRSNGIEIMLVTSRETKRWVAPKGWPMKGLRPHAAAAREAFEEAGIRGKVSKTAIGVYGYVKRLKSGSNQTCKVKMFPLKVTEELDSWPERNERDRKWFSPNEAMKAVNEPDLRRIIHAFEQARTKSKNDKTRRAKGEASPDAASCSISTS